MLKRIYNLWKVPIVSMKDIFIGGRSEGALCLLGKGSSVGFPAFNFAVCVPNFVAATSHYDRKKQKNKKQNKTKNRGLTFASSYRYLQSSWLHLLRQFVWVVA